MKCVVTGGSGFIGSNLAEELVAQGHEVIVIDDLSTGDVANLDAIKDKITFIDGSILDLDMLQKAFKGVDWVFHQAAIPSVPRSIEDPKTSSDVNIEGTLNVLIAARDNNVKKVVAASSSSVYGDALESPKHEEMVPNPKSPYALTKYADEQYCKMFAEYYGLGTVCLRYFNVFGPKQKAEGGYAAVIPITIMAVLEGKSPTFFGDGTQTRDFTFVKDVVKANIQAAQSDVTDGSAINIAYNKSISLNDLLAMVNKIVGKDIKAEYGDPRPGDIHDSLAAVEKAKKLIGYAPDFDLESGMKETIAYFESLNK